MSAVSLEQEILELRRLIPLSDLPESRLLQISAALRIEEAEPGTALFHQGEPTREFVYLLSGVVSLQAGGVEMDAIHGESEVSRFALAHQNPRKVSAVAKTRIRYVRVSPLLLNPLEQAPAASGDARPLAGYQVSESTDATEDDWISALLRSPIFQRLPPANLQTILRNVKEVRVKAGDVVFQQGDEGDCFYIIKSGHCVLTRKPSPNAREIQLASLKASDSFGEDALISDHPRSLTAKMLSDGQLMKLGKADFLKLIADPIIARISAAEAIRLVAEGAHWLDVRQSDAFEQGHPKGPAIHAPFFSLRMILGSLDRNRHYVVACEDGKLSLAAAYLLTRFRFNASALKGGIASLPQDQLTGPEAAPEPKPEAPATDAASTPPAPSPEARTAGAAAPPGESRVAVLEGRLSRLAAEKQRSDAELLQMMQRVRRLDAALKAAQSDSAKSAAAVVGAAEPPVPAADYGLQRKLDELQAQVQDSEMERDIAEQKARTYEAQVVDLKAMVRQFIKKGGAAVNEEMEALQAELSMVREQAVAEVEAVRHQLDETTQVNRQLRDELQSLLAQWQGPDGKAAGPSGSSPARHLGWAVAAGILFAALVLGVLFGLEPGRDFMRSWLSEPASAANPPPG